MLRRWIRQLAESLERADAGGWALLTAGLMLFTVTALAPTWVELNAARDQYQDLADRRRAIETARHETREMIRLVREGDPLLLQRLAWRELRLQPASVLLGDRVELLSDGPPSPTPTARRGAPPVRQATLVRWSTGPPRRVMLIASVALMALGLLSSFRRHHATPVGR